MFVQLVCEWCGRRYERTPSVAKKSRYCSADCRVSGVSTDNAKPIEVRFWKKVDRSGGPKSCWIWTAGCFADGYGAVSLDGRPQRAPRVAYELKHGKIPNGLHIRHSCDNPKCVNPQHLLVGTAAQNASDKVARGRQSRSIKVTDQQVQEIRESCESHQTLADRYGVSIGLVSLIRGKTGHRVARPVKMSRRRELFQK